MIIRSAALAVAALALTGSAFSQEASQSAKTDSTQAVLYLYPEQLTLPAGKVSPVALHFRIAPGFHINSHTPKEEFLIPTVLSIPADAGVKLQDASYPAGADFVLPADPDTRLSVYTGEFAIQAKLLAQPGDHLVNAKLRYQACDKTACMPPKTITVPIDITGK